MDGELVAVVDSLGVVDAVALVDLQEVEAHFREAVGAEETEGDREVVAVSEAEVAEASEVEMAVAAEAEAGSSHMEGTSRSHKIRSNKLSIAWEDAMVCATGSLLAESIARL